MCRRCAGILVVLVLGLTARMEAYDEVALEPTLKSIYCSVHRVEEFQQEDTQVIVFAFLDTDCPIARNYLSRLTDIYNRLRDRGVSIVGIYSNTRVNAWSMAVHALDSDIPFPVFQDVEHRLADRFSVKVTPEVVVVDANFQKQYQGPIDNQYKRGGHLSAPTERYLEDALAALLTGRAIEINNRPASGCPLGRQPLPSSQPLTYYRHVAPIIQRNCQPCHRPAGVAPFELMTYEDAYYNAERIAEVVADRLMPPWHGMLDPEFGELLNDKSLSEADVHVVRSWADQGAPPGDPADAPPPMHWPSADDWSIGRPDFVYRMPEPFRVPKDGVLEYQFFRVRFNSPEDRWYRAVQVKPGNVEVVHHVAVHVVPAGNEQFQGLAAMAQLYGVNTQQANVICDYVPGDTHNAKTFPPDQACRIPKHSDLIYEVHYTPNNRQAVTDQSVVGFVWADKAPEHEVQRRVFRKPVGRFRIPPYDPHFRMEDTYYFESDIDLDAIRPHFHLRGKSFRLEIIERNVDTGAIENRQVVLSVPRFDQRWQRTYELTTPLRLLAGTELLATAYFDNSRFNPNNPNPSAEVLWGQQTSDEMFSIWFGYRLAKTKSN